jgi:hypothetical protein
MALPPDVARRLASIVPGFDPFELDLRLPHAAWLLPAAADLPVPQPAADVAGVPLLLLRGHFSQRLVWLREAVDAVPFVFDRSNLSAVMASPIPHPAVILTLPAHSEIGGPASSRSRWRCSTTRRHSPAPGRCPGSRDPPRWLPLAYPPGVGGTVQVECPLYPAGHRHQPEHRQPSAEGQTSSLRRTNTQGLVGRLGLEPRTDGLKVRCSAIELTPLGPARPAPSDEAYRLKR